MCFGVLEELLRRIERRYAILRTSPEATKYLEEILDKMIPRDVDAQKYIDEHGIEVRRYPINIDDSRIEIWMDGKLKGVMKYYSGPPQSFKYEEDDGN